MAVPCVRVSREAGEATRRDLADRDLLDYDYQITHADGWVYLPVTDPSTVPKEYEVTNYELPERDTQAMPADLLGFDPSYERLGDIVILHEDDAERAREIAAAVMESDLPVKTVVNRASEIKGEQRVREWDILVGNGTETIHREYGNTYRLDIADMYFSPRLATERHRVTSQVTSGEQVVDMFAGVGPFVIPMAKQGASCLAVDINPAAIEYLERNGAENDVGEHVVIREGDVREIAPEYASWADRIIMNLPHSADEYLDAAVTMAGAECLLHYYDIQPEEDAFTPGENAIREAASEFAVSIVNRRVVRSYAPHEVNVCLDVRLSGDGS